MKIFSKITNGIVLIVLGILHTQIVLSPSGFGEIFWSLSDSYFFSINEGFKELPITSGLANLEVLSTFWTFYFGIFMIPFGILVHVFEKRGFILPLAFTLSYLILVLIGSYMVPLSGMAFLMLPHAVYMLVRNHLKERKAKVSQEVLSVS